jgi:hypothetical protein
MSARFDGLVDLNNVRVFPGNIRRSLLNCPYEDCGAGLSNVCKRCSVDDNYPWLLILICQSCSKSWCLCRECNNRQVMFTDAQVSRHIR